MICSLLFIIIIKSVFSLNSLDLVESYEQIKFPDFVNKTAVKSEPCVSGNVTGVCVDYRRCPTFEFNLKTGNTPPTCGWNGTNPLVCCDSCYLYTDQYAREKEAFELEKRIKTIPTGIKHLDYCVEMYRNYMYSCRPEVHVKFMVVNDYVPEKKCFHISFMALAPTGGYPALYGQFPHMALIGFGSTVDSAQWHCGGSMITFQYILTAAHCSAHRDLGPARYVGVGMLKRSDPVERWQRLEVDRFISHPDHKPPIKYNDIALIKTKTKIQFHGDTAMPACLTTKDLDRPDVDAFATGWGDLGFRRGSADALQMVHVSRFPDDECSKMYPRNRNLMQGVNSSTQMCYGDKDVARDTCGGDSGGPLQVHDEDVNCIWSIIGVTSYGRTCGLPGGAGIYTRVQPYVPWIESIVWP